MIIIEPFMVLVVFALVCVWGWNWLRAGTPSPDPWDSQVAESMEQETAEPLCYHCLAPQKDERWFARNAARRLVLITIMIPMRCCSPRGNSFAPVCWTGSRVGRWLFLDISFYR